MDVHIMYTCPKCGYEFNSTDGFLTEPVCPRCHPPKSREIVSVPPSNIESVKPRRVNPLTRKRLSYILLPVVCALTIWQLFRLYNTLNEFKVTNKLIHETADWYMKKAEEYKEYRDFKPKLPATPDPRQMTLSETKLDFEWKKGGFGSVMMADFKVTNDSAYGFKDFEITCDLYAASGTKLGTNRQKVYEVINRWSTKQIDDFNMGFVNPQATKCSCRISDLVIAQ